MDRPRPPRPGGPTFSVTSKEDAALRARVFIGNLPTDRMNGPKELEEMFTKYGPVHDTTLHKGFGFVQFGNEQDAWKAIHGEAGASYKGLRLDVKMAVENRGRKPEERDRSPLRGGGPRSSTSAGSLNEPCRYFKMGNCTRGSSCFYRHDEPDGARPSRPPNERAFKEPVLNRDMAMRPDRDGFGDRGQRPGPGPFQRDRGDFPGPDGRPRPRDREGFDEDRGPRPVGPSFDPFIEPSVEREPFRNDFDRSFNAPPSEERRDFPSVGKPQLGFERPPVDCLLVACHQQQRGYCEMVERRLRSLNIRTGVQVPKDKEGVQEALEEATKRGVPYAIIVTSQNEVHRSLTLNILHGTPQEHRNMPLEDALGLVGRTFGEYMESVRQKQLATPAQKRPAAGDGAAGGITPPDTGLAYLLNLMADGHELTLNELEAVFSYVQKRKDRAAALAMTNQGAASADIRRPPRDVPPQGVPPGDRMQPPRERGPMPGGPPAGHATGTINFENPMVQRAMENISAGGNFSSAGGPTAMQKPKIQPLVPGMGDRPNRPFERGYNSYY